MVKVNNCDEKIVRNIRKRVAEAEKENIDFLFIEAYQRRSQFNKSLIINKRLLRQFTRYIIKNEFQRRKF